MNRKLRADKKRWLLIVWPLLILVSLVIITCSPRGWLHVRQLRLDYQRLTERNDTLRAENQRLCREIARLRNDPGAVEQVARAELGMVGENELMFRFASPIRTGDVHPR
jgi:cell division protein FtsB